jgi:hypothetical protein
MKFARKSEIICDSALSRQTPVARDVDFVYLLGLLDPNREYPEARSSAGEHFPDTEGVGGSIPPVPTKLMRKADDSLPSKKI